MSRQSKSRKPAIVLSKKRKCAYAVCVVLAFFLGLESLLWMVGVQPVLSQEDPFVGFSGNVPLLVETSVDGRPVMEPAENKLRWFNHQTFPKAKPDNTFRIFCLGGSTTYGRPFDDKTSYCGWLREYLVEVDPTKNFEVINAGGISYASYRLVKVMEELAEFEPDLFIVYTGHNEFLEERTYREIKRVPGVVRNFGTVVAKSRTYALAQGLTRNHGGQGTGAAEGDSGLAADVNTKLDNGAGLDLYHRDDELQEKTLEHFQLNLERMTQIAHENDAGIWFVTPAANLLDFSPFKSEHSVDADTQAVWQKHFSAASDAYEKQDLDVALPEIERAVELSPRHAATLFLHARILQQRGEYQKARLIFDAAKNEDVCPLRALSETVEVVRDAGEIANVSVIDFEDYVRQNSAHGIPGDSMFLDHVHPNIELHQQLALQLFDKLVSNDIVDEPSDWEQRKEQVADRIHSQIDGEAHGVALRNLAKVLNWAGKTEEANRIAMEASTLIRGDAETAYLSGNALLAEGKIPEAIERFREAIQISPNHHLALNSLASAYMKSQMFDEAEEGYLRVLALQPDFAPAHNNLGALFQRRSDFQKALHHYQQAIRINPRNSKALNNLGAMHRRQGNWAQAQKSFETAIRINPDFAEAYYNLGTVFENQGDSKLAFENFQTSTRKNPKYAPAHFRMACILEEKREWKSAAIAFREAIKYPGAPLEALRRTAWMLATCPDDSVRNGDVALKMAKTCIANSKDRQPELISTLAAAFAETGDFENARKYQQLAVNLSEIDADKARQSGRLEKYKLNQAIRQ